MTAKTNDPTCSESAPRPNAVRGPAARLAARLSAATRTIYWRISAAFLVILIATGGAQYAAFHYGKALYDGLGEQQLNWEVADELAAEIEPLLHTPLDKDSVQRVLYRAQAVHPGIEPYLLDRRGEVVVTLFNDYSARAVPLAPIEEFLSLVGAPTTPIYGQSPNVLYRDPVVFSAARLPEGAPAAYVYVVLGGLHTHAVRSMLTENIAIWLSSVIVPVTVVLSSVIGLVIFGLITRRFRLLTTAVERFEQGNFTERVAVRSSDEIDLLGRAFNHMADTIVSNIEALKETDALRRELIANVSHDLKKPLTVMQASLDTFLLRYDAQSEEERRGTIAIAARTCERLGALLNDMFDLSKLNTTVKPAFSAEDAGRLLDDIAERFRPFAAQRTIVLRSEHPPGLRAVWMDRGLIDRAISNLVDNAIRYTRPGGHVRLVAAPSEDGVSFSVSDTGVGISEEDRKYIFQRAYRGTGGSAADSNGSGLGLAIAFRIVELHHAELRVESSEDRGSTFSFELATSHEREVPRPSEANA